MKRCVWNTLIGLTCFLPSVIFADEPKAPATVKELWADFDPRKDELDAKVVREWETDGIVYRYVTYHIGTFMGKPARMAAFLGFPKGAKMLAGGSRWGLQSEIARLLGVDRATISRDVRKARDGWSELIPCWRTSKC